MKQKNRSVCDPQILGGKPCPAGTRIPAALVLGCLAAGRSNHEVVQQFHGLEIEDMLACLGFARDLADSNPTFS